MRPSISHRIVAAVLEALEGRRLFAAADFDTTFGGGDGIVRDDLSGFDFVQDIAIQSDGKILIAGAANRDFVVARYNSDGTRDLPFGGGDGQAVLVFGNKISRATAIHVLGDGDILAAGDGFEEDNFNDHVEGVLARFNSNGTPDGGFGGGDGIVEFSRGQDDRVSDIQTLGDNDIVVSGQTDVSDGDGGFTTVGTITRFNSDGSAAGGFTAAVQGPVVAVKRGPGSTILAAGNNPSNSNSDNESYVVRLLDNGSRDNSFGGGDGKVSNAGSAGLIYRNMAIRSNGKIVLSGVHDPSNSFLVQQINANGTLDNTFGGGDSFATAVLGDQSEALDLDFNNDKVVAVGFAFVESNNETEFAIARFTADGVLDNSFSGDGREILETNIGAARATALVVDAQGRYLMGGTDDETNFDAMLVRLQGTPPVTQAPEVEVRGNNVVIVDGDTTPATSDFTDFGTANVGASVTRTFTVRNIGTAPLTTSGLKITNTNGTASTAFTITEGLNATIPAGGSDNFTVRFNVATAGAYTRLLSFANNDANENPYNFILKATAVVPTFSLVNGVLTVTGTSGNDFIRGFIASNVLTMKMNNLSQTFANASTITRIIVNALAGNDNISLAQSVNRPTSLNGGDGNDSIYGGAGADVINGGNGTDTAFKGGTDTTTLVEEILA